jgi:hypothetical protein
LTTGPLTAGTLTAGTLTTGTLTTGTLTSGPLTAGTLTAGTLTSGTLTAGPFTAGPLGFPPWPLRIPLAFPLAVAWRPLRFPRPIAFSRRPRSFFRSRLAALTAGRRALAGPGLIAIAIEPIPEPPPLLVARDVEARARILVRAAGAPIPAAVLALRLPRSACSPFLVLRVPQPPAGKPPHHRIGMA